VKLSKNSPFWINPNELNNKKREISACADNNPARVDIVIFLLTPRMKLPPPLCLKAAFHAGDIVLPVF